MIYDLKMVMYLKACLLPFECLSVNTSPYPQTEQNKTTIMIVSD